MGSNISSLNNTTVVGWVVILAGVGYFGVQRYLQQEKAKANKRDAHRPRTQERQSNQSKKEGKAKRQRMETFATEPKQPPPATFAAAVSASQPKASRDRSGDDMDNRAFAQQMARNKQSKFAPKANTEQKQKSIKQSKAKAISDNNEVEKPSTPTSTADIDADDDQSSAPSPSVSAADATGVSDMLEQSTPGPSVLRLTGTEEKQQQKPKQTKSPQPTETKKQRQNRKRNEELKAIREEQEKERKVKMEAQRRSAREAEGRAAKDGSGFMAAQKASPWVGNSVNGNSAQKTAPAAVQPLDTFESTPQANVATPPATTNGKGNIKQNGKVDWADIPYSEEEQMAMLLQQNEEDQWVSVKPRNKKKGSVGAANSEAEESANEMSPPATTQSAPQTKPAATNGRPKPQTMSTQSSFAALNDDGADLEEEEHEWDV